MDQSPSRTVSQELRAIAAEVRGRRSAGTGVFVALALVAGLAGGYLGSLQLLERERSARSEAEQAVARADEARQRAERTRAEEARRAGELAVALAAAQRKASELSAERKALERKLIEELNAADRGARARELELRQTLVALRERESQQLSQIASLKSALEEHKGRASFAEIARRYRDGLFLVAVRTDRDRVIGLGTAFAVRADGVLATNAHVAVEAKTLRDRLARADERAQIVVVMNHQPARVYPVTRAVLHPDYDPDRARSWDAALLQVETLGAPLPCVLPIASRAQLRELSEGQAVGLIGFPGEVTDARRPIATFKSGDIGRLTTLDGASGTKDKAVLVQHSALATGGNSGSPLLNARGRVVALHTSGLSVRFSSDSREVVLRPSTGIHWALRADALWDLLLLARD